MSRLLNLLAIWFFLAGLVTGLGITVYLFTYGIDLIKNGQVFNGLLYALVWSELGGIAVGVALLCLGGICLHWRDSRGRQGSSPSA